MDEYLGWWSDGGNGDGWSNGYGNEDGDNNKSYTFFAGFGANTGDGWGAREGRGWGSLNLKWFKPYE